MTGNRIIDRRAIRSVFPRSRVFPGKRAFTLIELLISVGVLAVIAAVVIPDLTPSGTQRLESVARILASDLNYARSLSIQYNTQWALKFDLANNGYNLLYSGSGSQPVLLTNPRGYGDAPSTLYYVNIGSLGQSTTGNNSVALAGVALHDSQADTSTITFGPLGSLGPVQNEDTVIWLTHGTGASMKYVRLTVSWITGQTWIDRPAVYSSRSQMFQ